jgi:hypothetical protein
MQVWQRLIERRRMIVPEDRLAQCRAAGVTPSLRTNGQLTLHEEADVRHTRGAPEHDALLRKRVPQAPRRRMRIEPGCKLNLQRSAIRPSAKSHPRLLSAGAALRQASPATDLMSAANS